MRKLFALLFVAAAFTFAACEKKGGETGSADSSAVKDSAASDVAPVAPADSSAMKADSTAGAAKADSVKK